MLACRLRDLESPTASTSTPTTSIVGNAQKSPPSQQWQKQSAPQQQQQPAGRRDRQSTVLARQRSAPDKRKESSEEAKLREAVLSEVLDVKPSESWQDIAGLGGAKQVRRPGHSNTHSTLPHQTTLMRFNSGGRYSN